MGSIEVNFTKSRGKEMVEEAVLFFLCSLFKQKSYKDVYIDIVPSYNLYDKDGMAAALYSHGPNGYELWYDSKMNKVGIISSLAHECVHVWQDVRGEKSVWSIPTEPWLYYNHPLEKEAFSLTYYLMDMYKKRIDDTLPSLSYLKLQ